MGWLFGLLMITALAQAQKVQVKGRFVADRLRIGMPTQFVLRAHYPQEATVLFPDSTFAFTPFEFSKRTYFPTRTENGESVDSVVYELTSFEIDSIQYLQLPVFLVNASDCTIWKSPRDSIYLEKMVRQVPDSLQARALPMKINTAYQSVRKLLNYPILLLTGAGLIAIAVTVALVFGKRIRRYFEQRKLKKRHARFLANLQVHLEKFEQQMSAPHAEICLVIWKNYMEQLLGFPITKFTSKEIAQQLPDSNLKPALTEIDRMIYAGTTTWRPEPFYSLKDQGQHAFEQKLEELRYG